MPEPALNLVANKEFILRQMASDRASADPFPGPLSEAFCKGAIQVGEFQVRKIVASDWKILKALDSPILKFIQEMIQDPGQVPDVPVNDVEEWEVCLQFTRDPESVRELLSKGREVFRSAATKEIGDTVEAETVKIIVACVAEHIRRSWATALSYKAELEEKGEVTFFRDAAPAAAATG
jgi:hypothetical protein